MSRTRPATLVFGAEIYDEQGVKVGRIEDLVVDLGSGQVIYAVASFSEDIGMENRYYPIPIKALKESQEPEGVQLDISFDQLTNGPGFNSQQWPKEYEEDFVQQVYSHYGYEVPN